MNCYKSKKNSKLTKLLLEFEMQLAPGRSRRIEIPQSWQTEYFLKFKEEPHESGEEFLFHVRSTTVNLHTASVWRKMSHIWQKFGVSISTIKRIIKWFISNIKREIIYKRIRCRKLISSPVIINWKLNLLDWRLEDLLQTVLKHELRINYLS